MNVAPYRRNDDRAPYARAVALGERRADDVKRRARRLRRHEELGKKDASRLEPPADDLEGRHNPRVDDFQWGDASRKFFSRRRRRVRLEAMPNGVGEPRTGSP